MDVAAADNWNNNDIVEDKDSQIVSQNQNSGCCISN